MLAYILRRVVYILFILALISILVFAITQILPGNVATSSWTSTPRPRACERWRRSSA